MTYRGRFAPSPTGRLHFGSLVAALGSWLRARAMAGGWIVRIEDLDPPREVPGAATDILATLAAFGLESDEPVRYQSERGALYEAALARLVAAGHAYPCRCSRSELALFGGLHPPRCPSPGDARRTPAWRVRVPDEIVGFDDLVQGHYAQDLRRECGDFVVRRADGWHAYQLAVVVDDAEQDITEIVRGADLLDSTPRQLLLQRLLGLPHPRYAHLPLALDARGQKLSKHEGACPVDPDDPMPALRAALAFLGQHEAHGATPAQLLAEAAARFDLGRVARERAHAAMRHAI